jgi:hypothetical protein
MFHAFSFPIVEEPKTEVIMLGATIIYLDYATHTATVVVGDNWIVNSRSASAREFADLQAIEIAKLGVAR